MDQRQQHIVLREVALFLIVALVQIGGTAAAAHGQPEYGGSLPIGGALLLLVSASAVPLRLRHPVAAAWMAKLATLVYWSLALPRGPIFFALIITFGNLLYVRRRWHAVAVAVAGFVGFSWLGSVLDRHGPPTMTSLLLLAGWLITLFSAAEAIRAQADRRREQARTEREVLQRQVATERLRIARELHDVVAHNMSLINLQAGVALHLADDAPPTVKESLETIKAASKEALVEFRSILGVLRHVDDESLDDEGGTGAFVPSGASRASRHPTPGLDRLDDLIARARSAGVDVETRVDIDVDDVSRVVQLAAYRIVQESLTNVARHARPAAATVTLRSNGETLFIDVIDAGTGTGGGDTLPGSGSGLTGMRERAASVGGHLTAGPRMSGGFAVNARLPLEPETEEKSQP